jgi:hypothetical protein
MWTLFSGEPSYPEHIQDPGETYLTEVQQVVITGMWYLLLVSTY